MTVPDSVVELVRRYKDNYAQYRQSQYNETLTRVDFVNPLFEALGWDINNSQGLPETYRQVIHEDAIKIGGTTKAPDYSFRVGGQRKFFVETKKPTVNINLNREPAYQLRRYAWTATLPVSLLTNFEEFAVYDGRLAPGKDDSPKKARLDFFKYTDYPDRWDELAARFSHEAVVSGAFDQYTAEAADLFRGKQRVDAAFLQVIELWRASLAADIAQHNRSLGPRALNSAVQLIIDRIIFLRICEDRGVETEYRLQPLLNGARVYPRLLELFHHADARYNSGLFHLQPEKGRGEPDDVTPRLTLSDRPLKELIASLYYPDSPFEFSVFAADILGQVYEQFLGKVIRVDGKTAVVEDKPEVKKAGGVYYTPTYIVDYIVAQTVGELLKGKTPRQASGIKILDPACGSGSFLIGAYQFLLDWHKKWYVDDGSEKWMKGKNATLYQGPGGAWRLTTAEKKRILLNNLYGVDIDAQAVEVTKLSLLLKVLEGESTETINSNLKLFKERVLPDLDINIKCGNSLIGNDFYDGQDMSAFNTEARYRVNAFDWQTEFPEIMRSRGFHAVIGNPPWGQKGISTTDAEKGYIKESYQSVSGIYDLFRPFVERGLQLLDKGGRYGMVLPDIILLKDYQATRRLLLDTLAISAIDWWGMAFDSAVIDAATILGTKESATRDHQVQVAVRDKETPFASVIPQDNFLANPRHVFNLFLTPEKRSIIDRLSAYPNLGDYFEAHEGVHSGNMREALFLESCVDSTCRELLFGRGEIRPYLLEWNGRYLNIGAYSGTKTPQMYANLGNPAWYNQEKVLVRRTGDFVLAAVDKFCRYASNNFFIVFPKTKSSLTMNGLCALLNSRFMTWYFQTIEPRKGRVFAELKIKHLQVFPLPPDVMKTQGCDMLNMLGKQRSEAAMREAKTERADERALAARLCKHLDLKIDELVWQIFDVDVCG